MEDKNGKEYWKLYGIVREAVRLNDSQEIDRFIHEIVCSIEEKKGFDWNYEDIMIACRNRLEKFIEENFSDEETFAEKYTH